MRVERRAAYAAHALEVLGGSDFGRFVAYCVEAVPEEFFSAPASSTGKYHPAFSLGDGGLVRHCLVVVEMVRELFRLFCIDNAAQQQVIVGAALLHDCWKGVGPDGAWGDHTVTDHGELAAERIQALWESYDGPKGNLLLGMVTRLEATVSAHMVQWAAQPQPYPGVADSIKVLATADYMSSRRALSGWDGLPEVAPLAPPAKVMRKKAAKSVSDETGPSEK